MIRYGRSPAISVTKLFVRTFLAHHLKAECIKNTSNLSWLEYRKFATHNYMVTSCVPIKWDSGF